MDELFHLPSARVVMPRAYWIDKLSSAVLVVEPSLAEWKRITTYVEDSGESGFDMDILNALYNTTCLVLPHRQYLLLSSEFQEEEHARFLGAADETWVPSEVLAEAKYIHFSGMTVPKPWVPVDEGIIASARPKCRRTMDEKGDCEDRDIWLGLYKDFLGRRKVRCCCCRSSEAY